MSSKIDLYLFLVFVISFVSAGFAFYKNLSTRNKPEILTQEEVLKMEYNKHVNALKALEQRYFTIIENMNFVSCESDQMTDLFKELEVIKQEMEACRQRISFFLSQIRRLHGGK